MGGILNRRLFEIFEYFGVNEQTNIIIYLNL